MLDPMSQENALSQFTLACCCLVAKLCLTLWPHGLQCQAFLSLTISQSLPKFMSIELVISCNHSCLHSFVLLLPWLSTIKVQPQWSFPGLSWHASSWSSLSSFISLIMLPQIIWSYHSGSQGTSGPLLKVACTSCGREAFVVSSFTGMC